MVESKISKKQILNDLIKETESIKSESYKEGKLSSWSYKIRNSVKAIFGEDSDESAKVAYWLDKLPKPRNHHSGFSIVGLQNSVDDFFNFPDRNVVVNNIYELLQAFAHAEGISEEFSQTNTSRKFSQNLVKYLQMIGMRYDESALSMYLDDHKTIKCYPNRRKDLVNAMLSDPFYEKLQSEINLTWKLGFFTAAFGFNSQVYRKPSNRNPQEKTSA